MSSQLLLRVPRVESGPVTDRPRSGVSLSTLQDPVCRSTTRHSCHEEQRLPRHSPGVLSQQDTRSRPGVWDVRQWTRCTQEVYWMYGLDVQPVLFHAPQGRNYTNLPITLTGGLSLWLHQARLAGGAIMFSIRPSVHLLVRLSVCLLPNEHDMWSDFEVDHRDMVWNDQVCVLGGQKVKGEGHTSAKVDWRHGGGIILALLV